MKRILKKIFKFFKKQSIIDEHAEKENWGI